MSLPHAGTPSMSPSEIRDLMAEVLSPLPTRDLTGEVPPSPIHEPTPAVPSPPPAPHPYVPTVPSAVRPAPPEGQIVALVPAHNEGPVLRRTIVALQEQQRPPSRVIVITDNCTDNTEAVARFAGAEVWPTYKNQAKKAGALNQALQGVLPELTAADYVLIVDADSVLDPQFTRVATETLIAEPELGGCGGVFRGSLGGGFVGLLQRNEYARYARDTARLKGKALVLTGTATLFPVPVLRAVVRARAEGRLPGLPMVYDTKVLTEDNELSLAIMHLGYRIKSPKDCTLETEVMTTWADLYRQRLRWKRGAVENLFDYGLTRVTWRYWGRQLLSLVGVAVTVAYLGAIAWSLLITGSLTLYPMWLAVSAIFVTERVVTVRARGWPQMALASVLFIEMAFDVFLQMVHARAYLDSALQLERRW